MDDLSGEESRGRPARKRSFDDLQAGDQTQEGQLGVDSTPTHDHGHMRKKSRDTKTARGLDHPKLNNNKSVTTTLEGDKDAGFRSSISDVEIAAKAQDVSLEQGKHMEEEKNIPKKKRSRDQFDKDQDKELEDSEESNGSIVKPIDDPTVDEETPAGVSRRTTGEPDKKRHRDSSQENPLPHEQEGNAAKVRHACIFSLQTAFLVLGEC
jgi:hypothetical protein